ncbi:hypothetical protein L7F22_027310 [Adiantum nelumboides]|nr:hypothetical protein [Adiantum nelumboides]
MLDPLLDYVMLIDCGEPSCYKEAMLPDDKLKWERSMQSKIDLLHKNVTWDLVPLPNDKTFLPCIWVYKLKVIANNGKPMYKARPIAEGFKQQQGIDFDEIFYPVVKMTTLHCVLALVAKEDIELVQMDAKEAFLHGNLHENIYM